MQPFAPWNCWPSCSFFGWTLYKTMKYTNYISSQHFCFHIVIAKKREMKRQTPEVIKLCRKALGLHNLLQTY